jgi:hypothetical protein
MYTLQDSAAERETADAAMFARQDKAEAARKEIASTLQANPQIGVMMKKGKTVYYVGNKQSANIKDFT